MPILGLSIFQVWWTFNFPAVMRMGSFCAAALTIISILGNIWMFSDAHRFRPFFDLETFDDAPHAQLLKDRMRGGLLIMVHAVLLYVWYIDFHRMPDFYYVIWYAQCFVTFVLFYRAVYR